MPRTNCLSDAEAYRAATFDAATKGLHAWKIAKALNRLCPGIDFRGSTKGMMRDDFVRGELSQFSGADLRAALANTEPR